MSKIIGIDLGTTNSCVYVMAVPAAPSANDLRKSRRPFPVVSICLSTKNSDLAKAQSAPSNAQK